MAASSLYDLVPYDHYSSPDTHPDRLRAWGKIFGIECKRVTQSRVLEIGSAQGWNLLNWAALYPEAEFVGLEPSEVQFQRSQELMKSLPLKNIRFEKIGFQEFSSGQNKIEFDYIIAHGLFSWISREAQDQLLEFISRSLSSNGMAFVSFNVRPAWHLREHIIYIFKLFSKLGDSVEDKVSQGILGLRKTIRQLRPIQPTLAASLEYETNLLESRSFNFIVHEYLEDFNNPLSFEEFEERLTRHHLYYLADSRLNDLGSDEIIPDLLDSVSELKRIDNSSAESLLDIMRNRAFRRAMISKKPRAAVNASTLSSLFVSGSFQEQGGLMVDMKKSNQFRCVGEMEKAALKYITSIYPQSIRIRDLCEKVSQQMSIPWREDSKAKLEEWIKRGFFDLFSERGPGDESEQDRFITNSMIRLQAKTENWAANFRGEASAIDEWSRFFLESFDHEETADTLMNKVGNRWKSSNEKWAQPLVLEKMEELRKLGLIWRAR